MKTSEFFKQKTVLSLEQKVLKRTAPVDTVYEDIKTDLRDNAGFPYLGA